MSRYLFLVLFSFFVRLVFAQPVSLNIGAQSSANPDSLAKIQVLKTILVGTWTVTHMGEIPFREVYWIVEDSIDKQELTLGLDDKYELGTYRNDICISLDSGTWDVWYLPKGYYGDTIFFADGFYLKLNSDFDDPLVKNYFDYPVEITSIGNYGFTEQWECYCGNASPSISYSRVVEGWPGLQQYNPVRGAIANVDDEQKILQRELDSIRQNLVGIWRTKSIPYYQEIIRNEGEKSIIVTNRKRKKWNEEHDANYGYLSYRFNDDGSYLLEFINPKKPYDYWSNAGNWRVFADSLNPEKKHLEFYNTNPYDWFTDEYGPHQLSFLPDTSYELAIFNTYSDFYLSNYPGTNYSFTYFERMEDDILYVPQLVEILRHEESGLLRRLAMTEIYYNEDQNTWHLRYISLQPDCHPCETAYFVIDAWSGKIIERKVENRRW